MKIIAIDEKNNIEKELEVSSIKEAASKLNINLGEVIITKNNELVTEDTKLNNNDKLKFLSVISGG
jgi:sulfur carrier protein ThiS